MAAYNPAPAGPAAVLFAGQAGSKLRSASIARSAVLNSMPRLSAHPIFLHLKAKTCQRGLAGFGVLAVVLGLAAPTFSAPPFGDQDPRGQRQLQDAQRTDIRRSLGREEYRQDPYREPRRMSDAERQSLRQAVRDARS